MPLPAGILDNAALSAIEEAYGVEHEKTYGHRAGADEPVELVTLKVVGRGIPDKPRAALAANAELPQGVFIAEPVRRALSARLACRASNAIRQRSASRSRSAICITASS